MYSIALALPQTTCFHETEKKQKQFAYLFIKIITKNPIQFFDTIFVLVKKWNVIKLIHNQVKYKMLQTLTVLYVPSILKQNHPKSYMKYLPTPV